MQWLRNGVPLGWRGPAPREGIGNTKKQEVKVEEEIQTLLNDGASERGAAKAISPTFLIPKKDETMYLIHNLRGVNYCLDPPRFALHGARDVGEVTRNARWLAVLVPGMGTNKLRRS